MRVLGSAILDSGPKERREVGRVEHGVGHVFYVAGRNLAGSHGAIQRTGRGDFEGHGLRDGGTAGRREHG